MSNFTYWLDDFFIKIITFNLYVVRKIIRQYSGSSTKSVLDLGCGTGSLAPLFSKKYYVGVDIDEKAIKYAKSKYHGYHFVVGDATRLDIKKKFPLIVIVGVLHHINDRDVDKTSQIIVQHLTSGGRVVIIEAIYPIHTWNVLGRFLRLIDRGMYIRDMVSYKSILEKHLEVDVAEESFGGIIDYAIFVANHKKVNTTRVKL